MSILSAFNFQKWIDEYNKFLKPPILTKKYLSNLI